MLAFESLTPEALLKEAAEYIRMEALRQHGTVAILDRKPRLTRAEKEKRARHESADNALRSIAQDLEGAGIIPAGSTLRVHPDRTLKTAEATWDAGAAPLRFDMLGLVNLTEAEGHGWIDAPWNDLPLPMREAISRAHAEASEPAQAEPCAVLTSWQHEGAITTAANESRPWTDTATATTRNEGNLPAQRTVETINAAIDNAWKGRKNNVDWLGYESVNRDILACELLSAAEKLELIREATAAFTGRG